MLGGISKWTEYYLKKESTVLFHQFFTIVEREYNRVFPFLEGENIPFYLPNTFIPLHYLDNFTDCSC